MPARWLTNGVTTPGRHDSGPRAILTGISRVWAEKLDVPVSDDCSSGKFALALSRVTEIDEQVVAAMAASLARGGPVTSARGVRACIRRVAGCATPTGSASHAGETTNLKLKFHMD